MRTLENAARRWGFYRVAGCDEVGRGDGPGERLARDQVEQPLALGGGDRLRIADARNIAMRIEDHRRGDNGARKAAAPHLVDTSDVVEAHSPERVLQRSERPDLDHRRKLRTREVRIQNSV